MTRINWQGFLDRYWPVIPISVPAEPSLLTGWDRWTGRPPRAQIVTGRVVYNGWDQMLNTGTNDIPKHAGFRLQRKARNPEQPAVCPICSCKAPDKPEGTSANPINPARPHPEREGREAEAGKDIRVLSRGLRSSWFQFYPLLCNKIWKFQEGGVIQWRRSVEKPAWNPPASSHVLLSIPWMKPPPPPGCCKKGSPTGAERTSLNTPLQ